MNILVTGASGQLGHDLVIELAALGHHVFSGGGLHTWKTDDQSEPQIMSA